MIAIDTNIVLRYLVADDIEQAAIAIDLIENRLSSTSPGFLAVSVLVETAWVLKRRYGQAASEIRNILAELLLAPQLIVDQAAMVERALASKHPDFADALIHEIGRAAGCVKTVTFDRSFARLNGVELLRS